tara:strand:- start:746 stop:949 length:204 start_codon:yes stop_codon:yes gene_type:complete
MLSVAIKNALADKRLFLTGGFGSFLLESGLNFQAHCLAAAVCGEVGTQDYLKDRFGFNSILIFGINE